MIRERVIEVVQTVLLAILGVVIALVMGHVLGLTS